MSTFSNCYQFLYTLRSYLVVQLLSRVRLFATPWTVAYQAPPSTGFSRQEYWSGLPFPSPGESSQTRDRTRIIGRRFYRLSHQGSPKLLGAPNKLTRESNRCCCGFPLPEARGTRIQARAEPTRTRASLRSNPQ